LGNDVISNLVAIALAGTWELDGGGVADPAAITAMPGSFRIS